MLRIVHTADCHLDAPCASLDAGVRARVRAAEREAFARVCSLAIEREAHALVIAGDVFERSDVGPAALHHVLAQLARVTEAGVAVIVASGNHDPGQALAPLAQAGCTLALTHEPVVVELADAEGAPLGHVVAIGHAGAADGTNLAQLLPQAPSPVSIAVLHAQVDGAWAARERYAPCSPDDLDRGYAYWALGHVHERQSLRAQPPAWYAGCLSPHDVGEPGAKGALVVEIDAAGRAAVEFVPLAPVRFERLRLENLTATGLAGLAGEAMVALEATQPGAPGEELVVRLDLRGRSPLAAWLRDPEERESSAEELALALGALSAELRCEHLRPQLELDRHRGQPHLLGAALEIATRAAADDLLLDELAPAVLAGDGSSDAAGRRAYLAELLGELDETLAESLLSEAAS
ncbi:MAG: repair protein SbcD/Mre11 [Gaiellales bacterium]|nr:repair protein SbcD/Mre11 [Gaiellales bacterium]